MQTYPNYQPYQAYAQPYPDRLAQLQNQYNQTVNMQQQNAHQVNQGILWVSGEIGAKSYLVAPNSTVLLMDSDASKFYLKSADSSGMPSIRVFEYKETTSTSQEAPQALNGNHSDLDDKYVTREEYEALKIQYTNIMDKLNTVLGNTDNGTTTNE